MDLDNYKKHIKKKNYNQYLTPALVELLNQLEELSFSFSCYRHNFRREAVLIILHLSVNDREEGASSQKKEVEIKFILLDSGVENLPKKTSEPMSIWLFEEITEAERKRGQGVMNYLFNSTKNESLGQRIYFIKEHGRYLFTICSVVSAYGVIEAISLSEKRAINDLEGQKNPHKEILVALKTV
jgi:hypothetical protein